MVQMRLAVGSRAAGGRSWKPFSFDLGRRERTRVMLKQNQSQCIFVLSSFFILRFLDIKWAGSQGRSYVATCPSTSI